MKVSYNSVVQLLLQKLTVQTLGEFKKHHEEWLIGSLTTAEALEDSSYVDCMSTNDLDDLLVVVYNEKLSDPLVLAKDEPLDIMALAKLYLDLPFSKADFYKIIEEESIGQDMDPNSHFTQFDIFTESVKKIRDDLTKKVYPNDPCPCGAPGKKYKHCCGKPQG